jgi:hypothetical protein
MAGSLARPQLNSVQGARTVSRASELQFSGSSGDHVLHELEVPSAVGGKAFPLVVGEKGRRSPRDGEQR